MHTSETFDYVPVNSIFGRPAVRVRWQLDGHGLQAVDVLEVCGVAGIDGQVMSYCNRRDERVIGARSGLPARSGAVCVSPVPD